MVRAGAPPEDQSGYGSRWRNADMIEQGDAQMNKQARQDSVIGDQAGSGDATSAQSTGKIDPRASGWTKRV